MDAGILYAIQQLTGPPWLDGLMAGLSWIGNNGMIWILLAVFLLIYPKTRISGAACAVALLLSLLLCNLILKNMVARLRPYDVLSWLQPLVPPLTDFSFPSGHASASFAAATAIALSGMGKRWVVPAFALAALISFSRLYTGMHYPTDVLGGAALGVLCGILAWLAAKRWLKGLSPP
ncbi:MAG: phosphatase PAP2 family protein [Clostridiales bacterium]|nr:phosphatase PAP2 family protein [Clostridiales bacterium]